MPPSDPRFPDEISREEARAAERNMPLDYAPDTGRRLRKGATIAAGALVLGFVVVSLSRFLGARALANETGAAYAAAPKVDIVVARAPSAGQDLELPGETAAWYEATIYARVNGYVASWVADIGDRVKKGQVLATLETPELDAELNAARAQLQASRSQVAAREAEAEFTKTTNERWRDAPQGVVSEQEREEKKAGYDSAVAQLYAANSQVRLDQARVAQFSALNNFKQVTAPFDGTVTERKIDVGNLVTAGSTAATTPLYRVSQTDPLRVFVDVPQSAAAELMQNGMPAEVRARGASAGTFVGKVARAAGAINAQARTMRVEVDLPNTDHKLVPGMYVNVAFKLPPAGTVEVPAAALVFGADGTRVALVGADGKVAFSKVVIARDNGNLVELASGVKPGDRLVLNISSQISAGQVVSTGETATRP